MAQCLHRVASVTVYHANVITMSQNFHDIVKAGFSASICNSIVRPVPGISDHDVVFAEIDISPPKYKQIKHKVPIYRKADWNKLEVEM